jgi:transposase
MRLNGYFQERTREMPRGNKAIEIAPAMIAEAYRLAKSCEYLETVAPMLGIGKTTLYSWLKRGGREQRRLDQGRKAKADEAAYVELANAIKKGRAECEMANLELIRAAAESGQWVAAAWRLERSHPERWSLQRGELARLRKLVRVMAGKLHLDPDTGEAKSND